MLKHLKLLFLFLMLNFSVFAQTLETVSIIVSDQNDDLITVGIVSVTDSKGKKLAEIELGKTKKTPMINVGVGNYTLEIQSPGFKSYKKSIEIKKGNNTFEVKLELAEINVNINVEQSEREKRLEEAMGGYLSEREIANLPESGEDIKAELQKRYGDDILIRIDGDFDGSQIPSRAEISSIKIISNTFDAEFHEVGRIVVDIRTNTISNSFHGFANLSFNNSSLNARNPFALERQPTSSNNILLLFSGPLIKNKTSFSLSTIRFNRVFTQNFIAKGFTGNIEPQQIESGLALTTFGIKYNLPKNHLLNFKYQNIDIGSKNIGIGSFDLPTRGSNRNSIQHKFSLTESGVFKNKYANDFRFEFSRTNEKTVPNSLDTTILVLNAFNIGSSGANNRTNRNKFGLTDNLLFDTKKHSLKFGLEISYEQLHNVSANNINGTFTFSNLTDYQNQNPVQFSQTISATEYKLNQLRGAFYFQDYFKPSANFQLSLGLRYEWQNGLNDKNNFSPRIGYVWSPEKSGKFIVRGGIGVFYDWFDSGTISAILSNDGRQGKKLIIRNPGFPNPFNGGTISQTLPPSVSKLADNLTNPYIFVTQNGFNYKLTKALKFEGVYTFRKGVHYFRSRNINAPLNGVRPNSNFGIIQLLESSGMSREHTFELKINGYVKGVNIFGNYQLAKNISDFSSPLSLPMDNYNLRLERGASNLEQKHKFNIGFNFDIFKTINISPSFRLESGLPYTITTGKDDNGDTVFNDRPTGIGRNTENGEWLKQIDVRMRWKFPTKYFGITDKIRSLSLSANVRNLFNTANLTNYVGIQTSPFFRKATSARNARSIEFGLSFSF